MDVVEFGVLGSVVGCGNCMLILWEGTQGSGILPVTHMLSESKDLVE